MPDGPIEFVERSKEAGFDVPTVYGGVERQRYNLETTGTGVTLFDYDQDGRIERLEVDWPSGTQQAFEDVEAGRLVSVHETKGLLR